MNEQQIRKIVQDEIKRNQGRGRFGLQQTQLHAHTGTDGTPQIKAENVLPSVSTSGAITFASEDIYTININGLFTPKNIQVYGNVVGSGNERYFFVGSAQLGPSFYLQADDSRTVTAGGPQYPFLDPAHPEYGTNIPQQSSAYYGSESNTGARHTLVNGFHVCDIQYPVGTVHARMTVIDFNKNAITVAVEQLDSGWEINGNFVVT